MTEYPSAHAIGDTIEIGPASNGVGPPAAWRGKVVGICFYPFKVRYDIVDDDGIEWFGVDSAVVRIPGVPNPVACASDIADHLDQMHSPDPPNVVRLPRPT